MQIRSTLMMELAQVIDDWGLMYSQAATLFGVTQPKISVIKRGKINIYCGYINLYGINCRYERHY